MARDLQWKDERYRDLYAEGLLKIAQDLHMWANGSAEGLSPLDIQRRVSFLVSKLNDWQPSQPPARQYDDCVFNLLVTTVQEVKRKIAGEDLPTEVGQ